MLAPQSDFFAATPEGRSLVAGTRLVTSLARINARPSMLATQRPSRCAAPHNATPSKALFPAGAMPITPAGA